MKNEFLLIGKEVDLNNHPPYLWELQDGSSVTVGDLHANPIKFIYILIKYGILKLEKEEDYQQLVDIYKCAELSRESEDMPSSKELIAKFDDILLRATCENKNILVRLIGDEFFDRGAGDEFIISIYRKLKQERSPIISLFSNHVFALLEYYVENFSAAGLESISYMINPAQCVSYNGHYRRGRGLWNLMQDSVNDKLYSVDAIKKFFKEDYRSTLKLLDYEIITSPNGDEKRLVIFSHAPIGLETIKGLADKWGILYSDLVIEDLAQVIDQINATFNRLSNEDIVLAIWI